MKKPRFKTVAQLVSRAEAERVLGEFRELSIQRAQVHLDIEAARQAIEQAHAPRLAEIDTALEERAEQLSHWATTNQVEFGTRKSLELTHGVIGWRTGQPQLKTRTGFTWERVLETLQKLGLSGFIRRKEEVAKDAILAARQDLEATGRLKEIGCRVVQDEPFFIEPKIEEPAVRAVEV